MQGAFKLKSQFFDNTFTLCIKREMIDTDHCAVPVSYTHLDVYKRQPLLCSMISCVILVKLRRNPKAVSYTHLYFSMSVLDIYATLLSGASLYLLPKLYFSFPAKLLDCMIQNKINTIYWVPSALGIVANLKMCIRDRCYVFR